jgi:uncharacterized delta-60 repeat protein
MRRFAFRFSLILWICTSVFGKELPEKWVERYNGPANGYDGSSALAVDNLSNVYVTGYSTSGICYRYTTIKYDADGNLLWTEAYAGEFGMLGYHKATDIALDNSGNVYVTGFSYTSEVPNYDYDYATIKYSSDGNGLWAAIYNGQADKKDFATALAVDISGNVYVTGGCDCINFDPAIPTYTSGCDYATIKYSPDGNQLWVARYNGDANNNDDASVLVIDDSGNVYVTGESYDNSTYYDYVTIKYSPDGNQLWVARYNGTENGTDKPVDLAVDGSGNVYVTGNSNEDYATIKYSPDGNQLWVACYNGPGIGVDSPSSIALDSFGNIYVTGRSDSKPGGGVNFDYATIKYDPNGDQIWVARYNGPGNNYDFAQDISVDNLGNIYVTGASIGSDTDYDYTTIKYNPEGNQLWVARYNGPGNGSDTAVDLEVDNSGNVYVTGSSAGIDTSIDYVTIKYTEQGACLGPITGDLNNDCKVDFADFAMMALSWLECNYYLEEDCW